jgi:hypothetical protein
MNSMRRRRRHRKIDHLTRFGWVVFGRPRRSHNGLASVLEHPFGSSREANVAYRKLGVECRLVAAFATEKKQTAGERLNHPLIFSRVISMQ